MAKIATPAARQTRSIIGSASWKGPYTCAGRQGSVRIRTPGHKRPVKAGGIGARAVLAAEDMARLERVVRSFNTSC